MLASWQFKPVFPIIARGANPPRSLMKVVHAWNAARSGCAKRTARRKPPYPPFQTTLLAWSHVLPVTFWSAAVISSASAALNDLRWRSTSPS